MTHGVPAFPPSVQPTSHPLVARYDVTIPDGAFVWVSFGETEEYGRVTSAQPAPPGGGLISTLVAGMRSSTTFHMRACARLADGSTVCDVDHGFQTGPLPPRVPAMGTVSPANAVLGGVQLIEGWAQQPTLVADALGATIWYYPRPTIGADAYSYVVPLENGHLLALLTNYNFESQGAVSAVCETTLAGEVVPGRDIELAGLNDRLKDVPTRKGTVVQASVLHHDVVPLPNGHVLVLAQQQQTIDGTMVLGDAVIDLDEDLSPAWVWSAFDCLSTTRRPMNWPDWTHCNAIVPTPDGHLLVSSRHQHWIIKVDYADGAGSGNVLWRLGLDGDFHQSAPFDWFYGQHAPSIVATTGSSITRLAVFDNHFWPESMIKGPSRAILLDIDEAGMTAGLSWAYSLKQTCTWGGNVTALPNGHIELTGPGGQTMICEVTGDSAPAVVWQLVTGVAYRARRLGSLYPGVVWGAPAAPTDVIISNSD